MTPLQVKTLRYLRDHGPTSATVVGGHLWPDRRGRGIASHGGGDYKAQQYLGRLRKKGWTRVVYGEGSSQWTLTALGRDRLRDYEVLQVAVRPIRWRRRRRA